MEYISGLLSTALRSRGKKSINFVFICFGTSPVMLLTRRCTVDLFQLTFQVWRSQFLLLERQALVTPSMALRKRTGWRDLNKLDLRIATSTISQPEAFSRPPHSWPSPGCQLGSIWCLLCWSVRLNSFSPSQWRGRMNPFPGLYTPSQNCYLKYVSSGISVTVWWQETSDLSFSKWVITGAGPVITL